MFEFSKYTLYILKKDFLISIVSYYLKRIAINERVMWRKYPEGVTDALIDNINISSGGVGDATLRLRRCFVRIGYVPQDAPKSETNVTSELNDFIRFFIVHVAIAI